MRTRRLQIYWFPLVTTLAVVLAGLLLDLPERAALFRNSQYGFQLWSVDTSTFLTLSVVLLVVVWTIQLLTDEPQRPSPWSHLVLYVAFGVLFLDLMFLVGSVGRSEEATGSEYWWVVGLIVAAWAGRFVATRVEDTRAREEGLRVGEGTRRPALRLGRTEAALWVGRKEMWGYRWQVYLGPVFAVVAAALLGWTYGGYGIADLPMAIFFTVTLIYGYLTMSVTVVVDETKVRIEGGPFRVPLWRIPLSDIEAASVEQTRPRAYGGYGYQAKGGRRALIVGTGDALVLQRRNGRDVVVTVDGAEEGAGLVNGLVRRRETAATS